MNIEYISIVLTINTFSVVRYVLRYLQLHVEGLQ